MYSLNKYLINLSYLGTNYSGWQIQDNANTIQGMIMNALQVILDKDISLIVGAGRTDSGVHAVNYFAHFEYSDINELDLSYKLNKFLPKDIVIHFIKTVPDDFHARFSAISRKYEYWISTVKDPFLINRAYFFFQKLDLSIMNEATSLLIGTNNFSAFSKTKQINSICCVKQAYWTKSKNMLLFSIEADRFLHNMVRCIIGTLIDVGLKKIDLKDFTQIMNSNNRSDSGYSVPAHGLYLMNVKYPKQYNFEKF